jgi:hypothetical protein
VGILILGVYPNWVQSVASKGHPRLEPVSAFGFRPIGGR